MKIGIRKPNVKSSIKARTTGKLTRCIKRSVNPLYGKRGMGYINNPKKALYNAVYRRTSVSVSDIAKMAKASSHNNAYVSKKIKYAPITRDQATTALTLCWVLGIFGAHRFYLHRWSTGMLYLCTAGLCFVGWIHDIVVLRKIRNQL